MKSELREQFEKILNKGTAHAFCNRESLLISLGGLPFVSDKSFEEYYKNPEYGLKEIEEGSVYKNLELLTKDKNYTIINCRKFNGLDAAFESFRTKFGNKFTNLKKTRNFHWKKELTVYSNSVCEYIEQITNPKASLNPGDGGFDTTIHFFVILDDQLKTFIEFL